MAKKETKKSGQSGKIVSRQNHSVIIPYDGKGMVIPPRAAGSKAIPIPDVEKLGALPRGIILIKD